MSATVCDEETPGRGSARREGDEEEGGVVDEATLLCFDRDVVNWVCGVPEVEARALIAACTVWLIVRLVR